MNKIALPLKYSSHRQIVDANGNLALEVFSGGMGIEAADELQDKVVAAVNVHDDLVAALQKLIKYDSTNPYDGVQMMLDYAEMLEAARAALAKAGA